MKNVNKIFCAIIILTLFAACSNDEFVDITDDCEFKELFVDNCFWGHPVRDTYNFVFFNSSEFEAFAETKRKEYSSKDCEQAEIPKINFFRNTLLGAFVNYGGGQYLERTVFKNSETKTIIYQIDINIDEEIFGDAIAFYDWNWVLIPRINEEYTFEIVINDTTNKE